MLILLGLTVTTIITAAYIHSELRSTWFGLTLSNGMEVLVSPEMYEGVVRRYQASGEPDAWKRWDQSVLGVLRAERPNEWRFLARALASPAADPFRTQDLAGRVARDRGGVRYRLIRHASLS